MNNKNFSIRFNLRALIVLTFVVCVALGFYPRQEIADFQNQFDAAEALGSVRNVDVKREPLNRNLRFHFLKLFIPESQLNRAVEVKAQWSGISDHDLRHMKHLPYVKRLYLANSRVSDAGMAHLSDNPLLERVSLWSTQVTDDGLASLTDKEHLKVLDIGLPDTCSSSRLLTPVCLWHLEHLPNLRFLKLPFDVDEDTGKALSTLPNYSPKKMTILNFSEEGIRNLPRWQSLESLTITGGTFDSLKPLQLLPNLESLEIRGGDLKEAQLLELPKLDQLQRLTISCRNVSNSLASDLAKCRRLKWLNLRGASVTCDLYDHFEDSKVVVVSDAPNDIRAIELLKKQNLFAQISDAYLQSPAYIGKAGLDAVTEYEGNLQLRDITKLKRLPPGIRPDHSAEPIDTEAIAKVLPKLNCDRLELQLDPNVMNLDCLLGLEKKKVTINAIEIQSAQRIEKLFSKPNPAIFGLKVDGNRRKREIILKIRKRKNGNYSKGYMEVSLPVPKDTSLDFQFVEFMPNLTDVTCSYMGGRCKNVSALLGLKQLRILDIRDRIKCLDFDTLAGLGKLPSLETLSCELEHATFPSSLDDQIFFPSLSTLNIKLPPLAKDCLKPICQIESLERLSFDIKKTGSSKDEETLLNSELTADFDKLQKLRYLNIDGVTDEVLKNICQAKGLREIGLLSGKLTLDSIAHLESLPRLNCTYLNGNMKNFGLTETERKMLQSVQGYNR